MNFFFSNHVLHLFLNVFRVWTAKSPTRQRIFVQRTERQRRLQIKVCVSIQSLSTINQCQWSVMKYQEFVFSLLFLNCTSCLSWYCRPLLYSIISNYIKDNRPSSPSRQRTHGAFLQQLESEIGKIIDWLIIDCFMSRSRIFRLYEDITITGEWLQNLCLCSALRAFEQGGIFIVPLLLWHKSFLGFSGFIRRTVPFSQGDLEDLF
jgi:hypothetical protein